MLTYDWNVGCRLGAAIIPRGATLVTVIVPLPLYAEQRLAAHGMDVHGVPNVSNFASVFLPERILALLCRSTVAEL